MRVFISAGEPSGDMHAANLVAALGRIDPESRFAALGGARLEAAGAELLHDMLSDFSVMGFGDALRLVPRMLRLRRETLEFLDDWKPDVAVLVDYPGFNIYFARHLKRRGIPVVYYICPQVWAWAPWRVKKIARRIDEALSVFEFEAEFYRAHGVEARYVGHPLGDLLAAEPLDGDFIDNGELSGAGFLVALVPGSRMKEIEDGFPVKVAAAMRIRRERPDAVFAVTAFKEEHIDLARAIAEEAGLDVKTYFGKTHEIMKMADFALATSGTATLELAHFQTPMVVLYRTSALGLVFKKLLVNVPHISLVNIIAGREIVPELVYWRDHGETVARLALDIISDPERYEEAKRDVKEVGRIIDAPGASENAAREIRALIERS